MTELPIFASADGFAALRTRRERAQADGITADQSAPPAAGGPSEPAEAKAGGSQELSERNLIERAKRDPEAFAALYRQHYEPVVGYVYRRVGNVHATEDLVAEVFLTAMRSLRRYRYRGVPLRAWLYRIATNVVNRWASKQRKRVARSLTESCPARACSDGFVTADHLDAAGARVALLSLKPKCQTVLALYYLEGMSVEMVATVTECRIGTVKSRLSRARQALRDRLTQGR